MNIFNFTAEFDSETSCSHHFKMKQGKIEISCKKCFHKEHYWIKR